LFDRLGGKPAVEAVVDEFLQRVAADKRINGRFFNTDLPRLRGLLIEFVCSSTGGPCQYTGRDMKSAHAGFQLVDEEFNALVEDLVGALDKFHVPKKEKEELLGALGPLAKEIVNPPPPEAAAHDEALAKQATREGRGSPEGRQGRRRGPARGRDQGPRARPAFVRRAALQRRGAAGPRRRDDAAGSAVPRRRARADHDRAEDAAAGHARAAQGRGRRLGRRGAEAEERLARRGDEGRGRGGPDPGRDRAGTGERQVEEAHAEAAHHRAAQPRVRAPHAGDLGGLDGVVPELRSDLPQRLFDVARARVRPGHLQERRKRAT
jgi:hemoglobin